jgi:hypothetical protein
MVRKFARGDRVKLTDLMVRTIMRGVAMPRKRNNRYVNWEGRFGEVISASSTNVVILWDGRRTYDQWPPAALEKSRSVIDTLGGDQRERDRTRDHFASRSRSRSMPCAMLDVMRRQ